MHAFIWLNLLFLLYHANGTILQTKQGSLKGDVLISRAGRKFYAFYSIPYAEPPIGELRFKDPVPAKRWGGVRDATVPPPVCLSTLENDEILGQEDCLYLNVYTPKITNRTLMPVMVFVYGGRFMFGNALPTRYGPHYFMDKNVVLITFHYRLGALGFLSTEDEVIPGNYGLKDQVAVLKWVQEYIDSFGGDKNRVTVFGGSSGGATVALNLISPLTKGLFHRVISQSGLPGAAPPGSAIRHTWKFASLVGCDDVTITTSEALLACLKKLPAETFILNQVKLFQFSSALPASLWSPVVENEKVPGAFLVDVPSKLFSRKSDIPWITGMNADDGAMTAIFFYYHPALGVKDELAEDYRKYFPLVFNYARHFNDVEQLNNITEALKQHYFGNRSIRDDVHAFSKMVTSLFFTSAIKYFSGLYNGPMYVYYYDHKNQETFAHTYAEFDGDMGIIHGDELISFFNWSEVITPVTEGIDLTVSKQVIQLWTNFAETGNPNGDEQVWQPVDSPDINYLHIKNGLLEMKDGFQKSECDFLKSIGYLR